ncbi:hypothetical protein GCM10010441_08400 [Kitasatospora paracochleata]|uniref:Secreted protein n=1 Tax=Kitasatospora paracochleata TaxID=58354 RepID=A0ABT1IX63_9ACTN|nr:hypothetical protein [Kitasatospora paracochleata]MCP2309741.1 hypothetical protein [Kitasatospora paracochleata]
MRATWAAAALTAALSLTAATAAAAVAAPANPSVAADSTRGHPAAVHPPISRFAPPGSLFAAMPKHPALSAKPGVTAMPPGLAAGALSDPSDSGTSALPSTGTATGPAASPADLDVAGLLDQVEKITDQLTEAAALPDLGVVQQLLATLTDLLKGLLGGLLPVVPPS